MVLSNLESLLFPTMLYGRRLGSECGVVTLVLLVLSFCCCFLRQSYYVALLASCLGLSGAGVASVCHCVRFEMIIHVKLLSLLTYVYTCAAVHVWKSEDNRQGLVLSLYFMVS